MTELTTHLRSGTLTAGGLALALVLTACGGDDSADAGSADDATTVSVETDYGTVEIPENPERVVSLEFGNEILVEAGIDPVGVIDPNPSLYTPEQMEVLGEADVVQEMSLELNIEAIAAAEPDLIIGGVREVSHEDYEQHFEDLSQIAPTVLFDFDGAGPELRDMSLELAEVIGDAERAEAERDRYQERLDEIGQTYADQLQDNTFAVVFGVEDEFAAVNTNAWGAYILDELGAEATSLVEEAGDDFATFQSYENIDKLDDADVVFYETDVSMEPDAFTADLLDQRLWQSLPAAENDQVHPMRYSFSRTWGQANDVLDQLEEVLADL
ncbi:MAG TPA: ABC transporter substrate-binding protein [Nocardiopsis listeri]|uniref:ABC transporter substrate-binding protein n=1 Tax=Nocardiopsis listeri TaxID=53440 RepID=UPI001D8BD234|nr:ABC transporter substrate-binding protein [Nocardiopsis listeri]HJE59117.1 ABC transporter substrate-binding protein [Nocardiopsis listeri]